MTDTKQFQVGDTVYLQDLLAADTKAIAGPGAMGTVMDTLEMTDGLMYYVRIANQPIHKPNRVWCLPEELGRYY